MDTKGDTIIKVVNLTAAFDDTVVIDDVSFEVPRGQVFVIMGVSLL